MSPGFTCTIKARQLPSAQPQLKRAVFLKRIILISLFISMPTLAWSDTIFKRSDVEQRYLDTAIEEFVDLMSAKGFPKLLSEDQGITLEDAHKSLHEMASLVAICTVLGMRLYEPEFKNEVGRILSNGGTARDVKLKIQEFLHQKVLRGELDSKNPFGPIIVGLEFSESCIDSMNTGIKHTPIPSLAHP